jgi:mannose-6-phosphate isomerase-like protein (cupin superfamily)
VDDKVQIVDADANCPALPLVEGQGQARAVIWPGIGARLRSVHMFELAPGDHTKTQCHPMEAVYFVVEGEAFAVDPSVGSRERVMAGSMIFVEPDTPYEIHADGGPVRFFGGPCPPDPALYEDLSR